MITPRRTRLLAAKLITLAAAGLDFGLAASGIAAAIIASGAIATALSAARQWITRRLTGSRLAARQDPDSPTALSGFDELAQPPPTATTSKSLSP